ncbi:uncharacterized protein LOC113359690 [Papaver somniferum]|uniref:uncharacterized protein LOC113359690 n=1 Tax=Papaver somniferum TaxID=3469 RepID=UPI000E7041D7|nr:uncharacterized protein LOC113359690 [Papaver somniferum]
MNLQVPKLPEFDEKTYDPDQHVLHYETAMTLWHYNDELMCKMFPQSLTGGAITWLNQLPAQSIGTYHKLVEEFCSHYKYNRSDRKGCHTFFLLGIRKEEIIRKFTRRFKQELADVDGANDQVVIAAFKQRQPKTLEELYDRAEEYARVEDDSKARETREVNRSSNHPNDGKKDKSKNRSSGKHNDRGEVREKNHGERMETGYQKHHDMKLTPLNIRLTELYQKISKDLSPSRPLTTETRDKSKYFNYHKDIGHTTENCRSLQIEVQRMIDAGKLQERASEDETRRKLRQLNEWYVKNHIDFVSGNGTEILELGCTKIEFSEADMIGAYSCMNLSHNLIEDEENPIIGFSGEVTKAIGKVNMLITVTDKSVLGKFLLLDCRAPYNVIVGRDWMHAIGAVASSYHQCLKFITPEGVVKVRSDQMAAHKCHGNVMDEYRKSEVSSNHILRVKQK